MTKNVDDAPGGGDGSDGGETNVAPSGESPPASLWRNAEFLRFWGGETLSLYGIQITALALPLTAVLVFQASPGELGMLRFVQMVPYLGLALLFGVWVDRSKKRPMMLGANISRMVLIGLVPVFSMTGLLNLPVLYVLALGIGIASVLFDVSWMSYVPSIVRDRRSLLDANAKLSTTSSSAEVVGPGIAGLLVSSLSAPTAMAVNAVSYAVSVVSLFSIRAPEPVSASVEKRRLRTDLAEGLRWVFGNRYLRAIALVGSSCNFFMIMVSSLFLLYAVQNAGLSPSGVGFILGAGSVGGLIGAVVSGPIVRRFAVGRIYAVSVAVIFLGPLLIPAARGPKPVLWGLFIASFFIAYMGVSVANVVIVSLRQAITPDPLMGRMSAATRMLMFGGGALGGPVGGLVADQVGLHSALWVAAGASAVMLVPIALSPVTRLKSLPAKAAAASQVEASLAVPN
ncbi:MFS transporter [Streptomyces sp. Edi2]|uniref:MFS transporter n=1 Tax=Streptomyces sp. Edi2 TaxID=3162528 RepID=UPI003306604E